MRCRGCNRLLEGEELYRKGDEEDWCYVCVPMAYDTDDEIPLDMLDMFDDPEDYPDAYDDGNNY